jgi:hypothetical protein
MYELIRVNKTRLERIYCIIKYIQFPAAFLELNISLKLGIMKRKLLEASSTEFQKNLLKGL